MLLPKIKKIPKNTNGRTVGYPSTRWASCLYLSYSFLVGTVNSVAQQKIYLTMQNIVTSLTNEQRQYSGYPLVMESYGI